MKFIPFVVVTFVSHAALAKGLVKAAAYYSSSTSNGNGSTRTVVDATMGLIREKGWTFGLNYQMDKSASEGSSIDRTSYGPTIGWITRKEFGWFVLGTYYFSSKRGEYEGSGYQGDGGYRFEIRHITYALQMSYKSFNYNKIGGASVSESDGHVHPYLSAWFEF